MYLTQAAGLTLLVLCPSTERPRALVMFEQADVTWSRKMPLAERGDESFMRALVADQDTGYFLLGTRAGVVGTRADGTPIVDEPHAFLRDQSDSWHHQMAKGEVDLADDEPGFLRCVRAGDRDDSDAPVHRAA